MTNYNTAMQKANFTTITPDTYGRISKRTAELDGIEVTQVTFDVGAKWSEDLKDFAGTESCVLPHAAVVISGTICILMDDGSKESFSEGDVMLLPPGHDAWTVGDKPCVFVEFSRGHDDYYS